MLPESEWPCELQPYIYDAACQELVKNPPELTTHVLAIHSKLAPNLEVIIDCNQHSSLTRLLRVTSFVFRFARVFITKRSSDNQSDHCTQLNSEDLQHAEHSWICHIQAKSFVAELEYLKSHGKQSIPTYVRQFGLFLDDQHVLRCKGRINNSTLSMTEKNPILLPSKHVFVKLLVTHVHQPSSPRTPTSKAWWCECYPYYLT